MPPPDVRPGFRISLVDGFVLVLGAVGAIFAWPVAWWLGFTIAYVVAHFFLFCNVFRIARPSELVWAGVFVALAIGTNVFNLPGWAATIGGTLIVTCAVIALEMRKPSYHGVFWQQINPGLRTWWASR